MEQLTKNQAVATSQEAVQNQNEPQLRDENAHNDKSVHGVLNPTYQAGLRRDAVQPDIEAELEAFYDNPNALRDYFRDIGRMVLAAEGRKANDSHADCYQYFCVPEHGTANGRLHFHAVHFMRTLPTGSVDPNFGRR